MRYNQVHFDKFHSSVLCLQYRAFFFICQLNIFIGTTVKTRTKLYKLLSCLYTCVRVRWNDKYLFLSCVYLSLRCQRLLIQHYAEEDKGSLPLN